MNDAPSSAVTPEFGLDFGEAIIHKGQSVARIALYLDDLPSDTAGTFACTKFEITPSEW